MAEGVFYIYSIILSYVLLLLFSPSLGNYFEGETQYLERGQQGVVACPALLAAGLKPSEVDSAYWYPGPDINDVSPIIVKSGMSIILGEGVPRGVYGINNDLDLIINTVKDTSAGIYSCRLSPLRRPFQDASVPIEVIVSPDPEEFAVVSPCDEKPIPSMCETYTAGSINVTCKVENTFPAVELQMWSFPNGSNNMLQLEDAYIHTEQVTVPLQGNLTETELLRTNNTFTRTASIEVEVGIEGSVIICNRSGPVPGKGKITSVVIRKEVLVAPTTQTTPRTGITTTKEVTTTNSTEKDDDHPTCKTQIVRVVVPLTIFFTILCVLLIIFPERVTLLKVKCGSGRQAGKPGTPTTTQMPQMINNPSDTENQTGSPTADEQTIQVVDNGEHPQWIGPHALAAHTPRSNT